MVAKWIAQATVLSLLVPMSLPAQDAPRGYRFEAGSSFTFLVAQETRPAQGPAHIRGELIYRFEVTEADAAGASLRVAISGRGERGADPNSNYAEARRPIAKTFEGLGARFHLDAAGVPLSDQVQDGFRLADLDTLALTPEPAQAAGSGEWAMVQNIPQFFPRLGDGDGVKMRTRAYGPDIFQRFPEDTPAVRGLLWTEEPLDVTASAPVRLEVGGKQLLRITFRSTFVKHTSKSGAELSGTYTMKGYALIDPALGRPVAFVTDDTDSQYQVAVTGGNFLSSRIARSQVKAANGGRTAIRLEAVDAGYLGLLKETLGLRLIPASELLRSAAAAGQVVEVPAPAAPPPATGMLGM